MVAYEFYIHSKGDICRLIGILPERRKDTERITHESIMRWVKKLMGDSTDLKKVRFVRVTLEQNSKNDLSLD